MRSKKKTLTRVADWMAVLAVALFAAVYATSTDADLAVLLVANVVVVAAAGTYLVAALRTPARYSGAGKRRAA